MISKLYALFLMIGGFVIASILSYYLNIHFDQKAIVSFLKQTFRNQI